MTQTAQTNTGFGVHFTLWLTVLVFMSAFGCTRTMADTHSGKARAEKVEKDTHTIVLPHPSVAAGKTVKTVVHIEPKHGWKWNKEYPARVEVKATGPFSVSPGEVSKSKGGIETQGKQATFSFQVAGKSVGSGTVVLQASYSICSDQACKIYRHQTLRFPVEVR